MKHMCQNRRSCPVTNNQNILSSCLRSIYRYCDLLDFLKQNLPSVQTIQRLRWNLEESALNRVSFCKHVEGHGVLGQEAWVDRKPQAVFLKSLRSSSPCTLLMET